VWFGRGKPTEEDPLADRPQSRNRARVTSIISRRRFAQGSLTSALAVALRGTPAVDAKKNKKKKPRKCPKGLTRCGKPCRDLARDPRSCGRCGNDCGANAVCDGGTCRSCDVCAQGCANTSVQAGIDATSGGGTLVVCSGTYAEAVTIGGDITLIGAGAGSSGTTLDARRANSVVTIDGADSVDMRGLSLTGGEAVYGGGVSNRGGATLSLRDCDISGNAAVGGGYGGGILIDGATATLTNCVISGNTARYGGGLGTFAAGRLVLEGCTVRNNESGSAGGGGGAYNLGVLKADKTTSFVDNSAETAGAIDNLGELTLIGTTVKENSASSYGGGIRNGFGGEATLLGCALTGNANAALLSESGLLRMTDCVLTKNSETAVHISAGEVEITGSRVHANPGIGLYNDASGTLTLTDSEVFSHTGGGIQNRGSLHLNGTTVHSNVGGGIVNSGEAAVATVRTSLIRNNETTQDSTTGGGINNVNFATTHLIDSTIASNTAGGGAGIYNWEAATLTLENTTVRDNRARTSRGGGIANSGAMAITGGVIEENVAKWHGGGISNTGALAASGVDIRANIAGSSDPGGAGGGLWNGESGTADLTDSQVRGNRSATGGGGITNAPGATLRLLGTTSVTNNKPANCIGSPYCP
jgi:hypothetical protein